MPDDATPQPAPEPTQFLLYTTEDGRAQVRVLVDGPAAWLSQKQIAELFETSVQNVNAHILNILEDGELTPNSTIKNYLIVQSEGPRQVKRSVVHYALPMILAVGFRVRSPRGTQFRRWASSTLAEFMAKGFILDDDRLKQAQTVFGKDYFDELLERIRDIRASEKRFYQKITDIYATATDYDPQGPAARDFFAKVQNKLEWAVTGMTGPEIIKQRADADKPRMGLATWKNAPDGPVRKGDITVAKNYLSQQELRELNRIVTMYLDFAEDQAQRHHPMSMAQWADIQRAVAKPFGVHHAVFQSWLFTLNVVRNICAHHSRLWNRVLGIKPRIPNADPAWHDPVTVRNDRVFGILTLCQWSLTKVAPQSHWPARLSALLDRSPHIPLAEMGFPDRWKDCPIWADTLPKAEADGAN